MGKAFAATTEILEIGRNEIRRQAVARFIIRLAQEDRSLDAAALRDPPSLRWEASHTAKSGKPNTNWT